MINKESFLDVVGIYCRYLSSSSLIVKREIFTMDPTAAFSHLTENDLKNGTPLLSPAETKECLKHIHHGMTCFHNRTCRDTKIFRSIGYIVRKLYEPYIKEDDPDFHEAFFFLIARAAFSLQMNNCPMARAFYAGIYDAWQAAAETNDHLLHGEGRAAGLVFDALLTHSDPAEDPAHDPNRYPWNMYSYNADNLILLYSDLTEYMDMVKTNGSVNLRNYRQYCDMKAALYDFFQNIVPYYKARCDYYNKRETPFTNKGNPVYHLDNTDIWMRDHGNLPKEYAPYLFYTVELFLYTGWQKEREYEKTAKEFAKAQAGNYDKENPITVRRELLLKKHEKEACVLMCIITVLFGLCIKFVPAVAVAAFIMEIGFSGVCIIGLIALCVIGCAFRGR
ncbi:MAG: hypothetical protein J5829_00760 [Lachnospiraceae bacterium]|nr:hypothetical protein [Lachnospiraceae bacterium]